MPTQAIPKIIAGSANRELVASIAELMSALHGCQVQPAQARIERFNDQEVFVEVHENVRGEDMFIVQSTSKPANDHIMELLIIADTLRRSSATRITAVIPYFGYARQDRRTRARTPISAKLVANMLAQSGIVRVLTVDLHAAQIQGFFDLPVDNLYASPLFALDVERLWGLSNDTIVVSPDVGGVERARDLARRIGSELAIVDKRREKAGEVAEMTLIGDVKGKTCLLVDDICDTAGTLCRAAEILLDRGAREVHAYITHAVMSSPAVENIEKSCMKSFVTTDTIEPSESMRNSERIRILPTAPLLTRAISNIVNGTSVSSLFEASTMKWIYGRLLPDR